MVFQLLPPPIPPIHVVFTTQELVWYLQPDMWVGIFTLLLAFATFWLGWETRKLREDSARAVVAAETSALAATRAIETSQEAMRLTLRAYLTVGEIQPLDHDDQQIPRSVRITIVNTGQTPASSQEIFYNFGVRNEWPKEFDVDTDRYATLMCAVIGRDQERSVVAKEPSTEAEQKLIVAGSAFLMAYGCVKYFDMFEIDTPRYTEFSYAWDQGRELFYPVGPMNGVT